MRAHALVIGIDGYRRSEWALTGAVRDAIAFARWALRAGEVRPEDLILLLSPAADARPIADLIGPGDESPDLVARVRPAGSTEIRDAFSAYRRGAGNTADRLWFYYAGHGISPPGETPSAGPLIIPSDVEDLDGYLNDTLPLGLEIFRGSIEDKPPKEQFFFVDACRDVVKLPGNKIVSNRLLWDLSGVTAQSLASQNVFLATTAGQRAKEIRGHGIFSQVLLAALSGLGPTLSPPLAPPAPGQVPRLRLLMSDVVSFVKDEVQRRLRDLPDAQGEPQGLPYNNTPGSSGPVVVAEFPSNALPTAKLSAVVEPEEAREAAQLAFLVWNQDARDFIPRRNPPPVGPPLPDIATFDVEGGPHNLRITAPGYLREVVPTLVYEERRILIELKPDPAAAVASEGLESIAPGAFLANQPGALKIVARDPLIRVTVFDGGGGQVHAQYGSFEMPEVKPGIYRVTAQLTGADRCEQVIQVQPGETREVVTTVLESPPSPMIVQELHAKKIPVDGNFAHPSDHLGAVANARLGSILAYAAWAARWPEDEGFARLRSIGVDELAGLDPAKSAVQVLIGDADGAAGGGGWMTLTSGSVEPQQGADAAGGAVESARTGDSPAARTMLSFSPLAGFSLAQQASEPREPGPISVRLEMPGFVPTSFAMSLIPGFVSVLVITREADGDMDIQQYLNPIQPLVPVGPGCPPARPDDVRLVELAWRALESHDELDSLEYRGLLDGKRANPLLGVIAGYRMLRTARAAEFGGPRGAVPATETWGSSALWNMVQLFPALPDVHVLAGLYDSDRRDEHFERARKAGIPMLVEGFWALHRWGSRAAAGANAAPPAPPNVMPGIVWTSFTDVVQRPPRGDA